MTIWSHGQARGEHCAFNYIPQVFSHNMVACSQIQLVHLKVRR